MKKLFVVVFLIMIVGCLGGRLAAQTYTFACKCEYLQGTDCSGCSGTVTAIFFDGLFVYRNGAIYRRIDAPYKVTMNGDVATISEINGGEFISINRANTTFANNIDFRNAINCQCESGGITTQTPVTVVDGQSIDLTASGTDSHTVTAEVLGWSTAPTGAAPVKNPSGSVDYITPLVNYGAFISDAAAASGGVPIGGLYSLLAGNLYGLPANTPRFRL